MNPKNMSVNFRVAQKAYGLGIAAGLLLAMLAATDAGAQSTHCADVNGDEAVTTVDALMVLRRAVGIPIDFNCPSPSAVVIGTGSMEIEGCGDVNGDGKTSTVDALIILQFSIGIPVEIKCPFVSQARNLIRYLNFLVCQDKEFLSTATEFPSEQKWESFSGVESPYQDWNKEIIPEEKFVVTTGKCGDIELFGSINLPPDIRVVMRLELGGLFGSSVVLRFFDEGPIGGALRAGDDAEPIAVLKGTLPAGVGLGSSD
jgi:hypothetical protein